MAMHCSTCHRDKPDREFAPGGKTCESCKFHRAKARARPVLVGGPGMRLCKRCREVKPDADFIGEFKRCSCCKACRDKARAGQVPRNERAMEKRKLVRESKPPPEPEPVKKYGCPLCRRCWQIPARDGLCGVRCA